MADMQLLKAKLRYNGLTYQEAGEIIGVGRDTFSRKMINEGGGVHRRRAEETKGGNAAEQRGTVADILPIMLIFCNI